MESGTEAFRQGSRVNPKVQPGLLQPFCASQRRALYHGVALQGRGVLHTRFWVREGRGGPFVGAVVEQVEPEADSEEVLPGVPEVEV